MEKTLYLSKKKKITKLFIKQLHTAFDSGINFFDDGKYRKVTYLFNLDTYFVGTNTPKKFMDVGCLMGLFYFKHINHA